jgi:hypothetical protein
MFCPKYLHELALNRIGCYLKQTSDKGMMMFPSSNVCKIDAYPDADFAGMYGHEERSSLRQESSRFIITLQNALSYGNQSYRQKWLCQQWKPRLLLFLPVAESFF